jgi:hypothetical protein
LYGYICVSTAHNYCMAPPAVAPVVGARIVVVQGVVTLQTLSGVDGTYQFPIGAGLTGPRDCTISTIAPTAPPGLATLPDITYHLIPGANGPLSLQVWSGPVGP